MLSGLNQWTQTVAYSGFAVGQFTASFVSGGPIIQSFLAGIESLTGSVLKYSTAAFDKAKDSEISRIAGAGAISNSFDKKLNFDAGGKLYDDMIKQSALSAAALPGATSEYITAFKMLSDDMASALNSSSASADELANLFKTKVPKAVENLVLQSKLYGQDIPISSVTKTYSTILNTGKVNLNEIFVKRNPVLKTAIQKWEKENGKKLPSLGLTERFEALNKIFKESISPEQMGALLNSFDSKLESLKSYTFDPLTGLFGFEREFKNSSGETTTLFKTLAGAIGPVIEKFTVLAQNAITFADPVKFAANFFDSTVGVALKDFAERLGVLNHYIQITEGDFETKFHTALKEAFNFDYKTFDFAAAITKFFNSIAAGIETFGDNIKPDDKFALAISALLEGLFKVFGATINRVFRQMREYPVETFKFVAVTNPGLIFQGLTVLMLGFLTLAPIVGLASKGLMALFGLTGLGPIFASVSGAILNIIAAIAGVFAWPLTILAMLAAIIIFKDQLLAIGKNFTDLGNNMSGPFQGALQMLGWAFTKLGEAGQALSSAWDKFSSGDWRGAVVDLFRGLVKTIQGLFGILGAGASAVGDGLKIAWDGLWSLLERLGKFIVDGIINLITGEKGGLATRTAAINSLPEINKTGAPLDGLTNFAKNQINMQGQIWNPGSDPIFKYTTGNPLGQLLATIGAEQAMMPSGSKIAIANSSEAILNKGQTQSVMAGLTANSKSVGNITVNVVMEESQSSAEDVGAAVRRELILLLD